MLGKGRKSEGLFFFGCLFVFFFAAAFCDRTSNKEFLLLMRSTSSDPIYFIHYQLVCYLVTRYLYCVLFLKCASDRIPYKINRSV